jgi:hypothetical protein
MALYLVESSLPKNLRDRAQLEQSIEQISKQAGENNAALVEVQIAADLVRAFFVLDAADQKQVKGIFAGTGAPVSLVKPVRLVGETPSKASAEGVKYLVEWNLPEGLTMEAYLARKKEKTPLYAEVPEVSFIRTYVCEDMTKCLCFYDAPDEAAVVKARQVVETPLDSITETTSFTKETK